MKKLAIIGANEFQNPLILKAKELGYETYVFAWEDGAVGKENASHFYPISIIKKDEILKKCKEIGIDGIATIASDLATLTVNYVAEKMNLAGNSLECTNKATNKYKMRQAFKENNVPTPGFEIISQKDLDNKYYIEKTRYMKYPLIAKPTDRSGSRSITKIQKQEELHDAIKKAQIDSFEKKAIVEEFIEGEEYSIEGISFNRKHSFLTVTKKQTTGAPNFIETGHIEPSGLSEKEILKIENMISKALDSLNISNSATHSEFKIMPNGEVRIIEIGARMGGDCIGSDLVRISTGYDYVKMVIDVAMGNEPKFEKISKPKIAVIKFIFNNNDLEKLREVKEKLPEDIYEISPIEEIGSHNVVDSGSRFGYYILASDSLDKIGWVINDE